MIHHQLTHYLEPGDACHYAQVPINIPALREKHLHKHDFHEVFWVVQGEGTHWIEGQERPLYPGLLTLICAPNEHSFSGDICLVNVAFRVATWKYLCRRYDLVGLFGAPSITGREYALSPLALREVQAIAGELASGDRRRLATERFLLNLFELLNRLGQSSDRTAEPDWLTKALRKISEVSHFQNGTPGLTYLAGRSAEHVARELRRWRGKTPTQVVNEARMAYAAGQLVASNEAILTIALDCGFESLGHFYRLFQATYATTPRAYRLRHQAIVRG